jgi:hypothetical protein
MTKQDQFRYELHMRLALAMYALSQGMKPAQGESYSPLNNPYIWVLVAWELLRFPRLLMSSALKQRRRPQPTSTNTNNNTSIWVVMHFSLSAIHKNKELTCCLSPSFSMLTLKFRTCRIEGAIHTSGNYISLCSGVCGCWSSWHNAIFRFSYLYLHSADVSLYIQTAGVSCASITT